MRAFIKPPAVRVFGEYRMRRPTQESAGGLPAYNIEYTSAQTGAHGYALLRFYLRGGGQGGGGAARFGDSRGDHPGGAGNPGRANANNYVRTVEIVGTSDANFTRGTGGARPTATTSGGTTGKASDGSSGTASTFAGLSASGGQKNQTGSDPNRNGEGAQWGGIIPRFTRTPEDLSNPLSSDAGEGGYGGAATGGTAPYYDATVGQNGALFVQPID